MGRFNPQTHPRFFRTVAIVGGIIVGLVIISCASGWPAFIWH